MPTDPRTDTTTTPELPRRRRARVVSRRTGASIAALAVICGLATACDPLPPPPPNAPACQGERPTIVGTAGADSITGTQGRDIIHGLGGNDQIRGIDGHDTICGGAGQDTIYGGPGADSIDGGEETGNTLIGGTEMDILSYSTWTRGVDVDLVAGYGGLSGGDSAVQFEGVIGTAFADDIFGTAGPDYLNGRAGNDTIFGYGGDDTLISQATAGQSARIVPGHGNDTVTGSVAGFVTVDYFMAPESVNVDLGARRASGSEGNDTLTDVAGVRGSNHHDVLTGSSRANTLDGYGGEDTLDGRSGNDTIRGGAGLADRVVFSTAPTPVQVDLTTGRATGQGTDSVIEVEHITGSPLDDLLVGSPGSNHIDGEAGIDICQGGGGQDSFYRCP